MPHRRVGIFRRIGHRVVLWRTPFALRDEALTMQTPTQEYVALAEESRKRRTELDDALRPILSKQRAIA